MNLQHVNILIQLIVFLLAISVHESAHAWMARREGDPTAYMLGRVTLNPLKHIDPIGTLLLPAIALFTHLPVIGWAKPTPVNTRNFKHLVRSDVLTSVAGPASNVLVATGGVILLAFIALTSAGGHVIVHNLALHSITDTGSLLMPLALILYQAIFINVLLAIFNLIPIPPLDGSHVLRHFLPHSALRMYDMMGMFALVALFLVGGPFLNMLFYPVIGAVNAVLTKL
ncbi:MAG TPA: site-2 protease family protein [Candidatus Angelobacter sp.]|nr:MAG: site-2 protease family protein [Acidobacteriota bacterium]HMC31756.1 site-2 protease family protein [Candidatus Angelobacter sp.]